MLRQTTCVLLFVSIVILGHTADVQAAPNNNDKRAAINAINKKISQIKRDISQLDKAIESRMKQIKEEAPKKINPILDAIKEAESRENDAKAQMARQREELRSLEKEQETVAESLSTSSSSSPAFRAAEASQLSAEGEMEKVESRLERALRTNEDFKKAKERLRIASIRLDIIKTRQQVGEASSRDLVNASKAHLLAETALKQFLEEHFSKDKDYIAAKEKLRIAKEELLSAKAESLAKLQGNPAYQAAEAKVDAAREAFAEITKALREATRERLKNQAQINRMKAEVKTFARQTDGMIGRRNFLKGDLEKHERNKRNIERRR